MSKSKRKTPIGGMACCGSDAQKKFRSQENRAQRRFVRVCLQIDPLEGQKLLTHYHPKQYGNEWASPRDGKQYWGDADDEFFRK